MTIMPENGMVLTELVVNNKRDTVEYAVFYVKDELPVYRIISVSPEIADWKVGDNIICNSTGTKLKVSDNKFQYLFNVGNIACKILN